MALKVVSMEGLKLEVLLEPERTGESVAEVCARHGISRASYYRYRRRYLEEGVAGLVPRSRRPRFSPAQIEPALEARIVELRVQPPAVATRPSAQPPGRAAACAAAEGDEAFRAGGGERSLADRRHPGEARRGDAACVVDCLDDHARFLLSALACASPSGEAAWTCFVRASSAYGLPRQLLSDTHSSFTGRLLGITVEFERKLAEVGVEPINAAPAHPQALGKLERFHRTLKEWLHDEGPAVDLEHLQLLLDRFRSHYNEERPHQGIANLTPVERYLPGPAPSARLGQLQLAEHLPHPQGLGQRGRRLPTARHQHRPPLPRRHRSPP